MSQTVICEGKTMAKTTRGLSNVSLDAKFISMPLQFYFHAVTSTNKRAKVKPKYVEVPQVTRLSDQNCDSGLNRGQD